LKANRWAIIYSARDYENANILFENLSKAGNAFGIQVQDP